MYQTTPPIIPSTTTSIPISSLPLKPQTHTINTMPLIRRILVALPLKHMAQMPITPRAHNLSALAPHRAVHAPRHGARHGVEKRRPPAPAGELVARLVQRGRAAGARVDACGRLVLVVGAAEGRLGAFFAQDAELLCAEAREWGGLWGRGERAYRG